jgi:hypothetical protein
MLSYLKWLFTPKSDRPAYVLDWFNKNVAGNPKLAPFMGRIKVEIAQDELRFVVSSGAYSDEQLWKVHCTNVKHLYTRAMECPNAKRGDSLIDSIIHHIKEVDEAVKSLDKYFLRIFDKSYFNLTGFDYSSSTFDQVSLCPAGVLPLMDATEQDIKRQGLYKDEASLKADLGKYYDYIIKEFSKRLKGRKPQASSPHMNVKTFEEWRIDRDIIAKSDAEEERLSKTCKKVLDDIRGYKNMGGAASCAAS